MAQIEGQMCKDSAFLKDHLKKYGFYEFHKIAEAVQRKTITRDDLTKCTRTDLIELCKQYSITTIQKNRFIEAIENLDSEKQERISILNDLTSSITQTMKDIENTNTRNATAINQAKETIKHRCAQLRNYIKTVEDQSIARVKQV